MPLEFKCSLVSNAFATDCTVVEFYATMYAVKEGSGPWAELAQEAAQHKSAAIAAGRNGDHDKANLENNLFKNLKPRLHALISTGVFRPGQRNNDGLVPGTYTGLVPVDVDNLEPEEVPGVRRILSTSPYVASAPISPSLLGFKIWVRCPAIVEQHRANAMAAIDHINALIRPVRTSQTDPVKDRSLDICRLAFLDFDPEIYINEDPQILPVNALQSHENAPQAPVKRVEGVGAPVADLLPPVTRGWFDIGVPESQGPYGGRNRTAFEIACQFRDGGASFEMTLGAIADFAARCAPPLPAAEAAACVRSAFNREPRDPPAMGSGLEVANGRPPGGQDAPETTQPEDYMAPAPGAPKSLPEDARYGLAWEIVDTLAPYTEASHAGMMLSLLITFGNLCGPGACFEVGAARHPMRLFGVLVGLTGTGRKGTAWLEGRRVPAMIDPEWAEKREIHGLGSGEALIDCVAEKAPKNTEGPLFIPKTDNRLIVVENEFGRILSKARLEHSIITPMIRLAWDSGRLQNRVRGRPAESWNAHISIIANITPRELSNKLSDTEAFNGFANRFLWFYVHRSQFLSEPGFIPEDRLYELRDRMNKCVEFSKSLASPLRRSPSAVLFWREIYPRLTTESPGLLGAIASRAEAQVGRLALEFAVLDLSPTVEVAHLKAALGIWQYALESATHIFAGSLGDPIADKVLSIIKIRAARGTTLTDIHSQYRNNLLANDIHRALSYLENLRLIRKIAPHPSGKVGRPATTWLPVRS
jgi:hypothetical protein